jgi:hypothetical protein
MSFLGRWRLYPKGFPQHITYLSIALALYYRHYSGVTLAGARAGLILDLSVRYIWFRTSDVPFSHIYAVYANNPTIVNASSLARVAEAHVQRAFIATAMTITPDQEG